VNHPAEAYPREAQEAEAGENRRRKATVSPDPRYGYVITIEIHPAYASFRRVNLALDLEPEANETLPIEDDTDIHRMVTERLVRLRHLDPRPLRALGITAPGRLDPVSQSVAFGPLWAQAIPPLARHLEAAFGVPCVVENDASALAIADFYAGAARDLDHFVSLYLNEGMGMGIYTNGQPYHGHRHRAGELAPLSPGHSLGREVLHRNMVDRGIVIPPNLTWRTLSQAWEQRFRGSPVLADLHREIIGSLAALGISLLQVLAPQRLFVWGPLAELGQRWEEELRQAIMTLAPPPWGPGLAAAVEVRRDWKGAMAQGTAHSAWEAHFLQPPIA
jgi:predicted NBD/HSP70 family sugar kinase